MRSDSPHFSILLLLLLALSVPPLSAQESDVLLEPEQEEVFEYNVGEVDYLTGEGVDLGGFLFPELIVTGTAGVAESGGDVGELAFSEHDPQDDVTIQGIELHLGINVNDKLTGLVAGFGHEGGGGEWAAELEEAYLHYHLSDTLAIGGGQFLNTFGFQADKHLAGWDFVNQNLVNARMLNEGELITHGGEAILKVPDLGGVWTIGGGGVRSHAHGHEHGQGEEHGHEEDEEHHEDDHEEEEHHDDDHHEEEGDHHLEADDANFNSWVLSTDYKFRLPFDESATISASLATGENGFGRQTFVYGVGAEKIWGAHDHGYGPEFCAGATMLRTEFMGRDIQAEEDGVPMSFDDYGMSTGLHYGLTEATTVSVRHDWVSAVEGLELEDRHRVSPALSVRFGDQKRIRARVQYDHITGGSLETEHVAWFQLQFQWGGHGGGHHHH